ncbi:MAG TPA: quinol:cytochrome C oxidoreductase, partial [Bacteroidia bacterium]|nr:quinol:cytochrome C oxidoreductase [Bacteroidia bacterium]
GMCFFFPFLWFMSRTYKRNPMTLIVGSIVILIGHWSDVYVLVAPGVLKESVQFGLMEIGMPLLFAGIYIFIVLTALSKANLFPKNHPYLKESMLHDTGL